MKKPANESTLREHPELTRAVLSCKVGRDALDRNCRPPANTTHAEYAMLCLLSAVEDIALAMMKGKQ